MITETASQARRHARCHQLLDRIKRIAKAYGPDTDLAHREALQGIAEILDVVLDEIEVAR